MSDEENKMTDIINKKYWSLKEVADYCGASQSAIRWWMREMNIQPRMISNQKGCRLNNTERDILKTIARYRDKNRFKLIQIIIDPTSHIGTLTKRINTLEHDNHDQSNALLAIALAVPKRMKK